MNVVIDKDVQTVLEFMQSNIPMDRLCVVAAAIQPLADALWRAQPAALQQVPIDDASPRLAATG